MTPMVEPPLSPDPERWKQALLPIIFRKISRESCIIFLFGSHAGGKAGQGSDIDLGILARERIPDRQFLEIEEAINTEAPFLRHVDFVDFATVSKKVREEALKEIRIWHIGKNCSDLLKNLKPAQKN